MHSYADNKYTVESDAAVNPYHEKLQKHENNTPPPKAETTSTLLMRSLVQARKRKDNADWTLFCPNEAFDRETGKGLMDASRLLSVAQPYGPKYPLL